MIIEFHRRQDLDSDNTATYQSVPLPFCFVGPRGVGKTSLLASMYQEIKNRGVEGVYIDLHSDVGERTSTLLNNSHLDMLDMIEDTEMYQIVANMGLRGNTEEKTFEFIGEKTIRDTDILKCTNYKRFRFVYQFTDMPGGWYTTHDPKFKDQAKKQLEESFVSFLAIDTPALMRGDASNERSNCSTRIKEWYDNALNTLKNNHHTVIIVLSRCEKFWKQKNEMRERLEKVYGSLIKKLVGNGIAVYLTWIKTLGGVEFSHYEAINSGDGRDKVARFMRTGDYKPENCATPLQLALQHGMASAAHKIEVNFWDEIGIGIGELALKAAKTMADDLRNNLHAGEEGTYYKYDKDPLLK